MGEVPKLETRKEVEVLDASSVDEGKRREIAAEKCRCMALQAEVKLT